MVRADAVSSLRDELAANRDKQAEIERSLTAAVEALGRHLVNLEIDAGFADLTPRIRRGRTIRSNLDDVEEDIRWLDQVEREYAEHRADLVRTEREAQRLVDRLEDEINALGEHGLERIDDEGAPAPLRERLRGFLEEASLPVVSAKDEDDEPSSDAASDTPSDARTDLQSRAGDIARAGPSTRLGWRLLRANSDLSWCTDPDLRGRIGDLKATVVRLLELERHQRFRTEGLRVFDEELQDIWGFETIEDMREDLLNQRDEMREHIVAIDAEIGEMFNTHRLHDRVDDSFVKASRGRIKRYHVRINELKLRRRAILLELRNADADVVDVE